MTRQRGDLEMEYGGLGGQQERQWTRHPVVLGILAVVLFASGFAAFLLVANQLDNDTDAGADPTAGDTGESGADSSENAETGDSQAADDADTAGDGADGSDQSEEAGSDDNSSASPSLDQLPDGAFVEARLNLDAGPGPGMFTLTGRVPDQATADAVLEAAQLSYAPFVESNLEVDESLEAAPWLATSPQLISLLPSVTDGTMMIADGGVKLSARSPNPAYLAQLEGAIEALSGLPIELVDMQITDLRPPLFEAAIDNGKVTLSGYVPSPEIHELLVGGAAAAYGPENVADELTVETDTYPSFWMYTMPGVFQLFSPFPMYSIKVQDGITSGTLQGGVNFGVDSTELSEQAAQVLNIGVAMMSRDLSLHMTVEGHTDSSGPDDYNQALGLARAMSVVAYFEAAGITADRLQAIGAGESEPIASNDTDAGKAENRRVEFLFGPPPSG